MSVVTFTYADEALRVKFDACTREPLSWKEELYAAARTIASKTAKPLWLCLSGGIDSEVMCQAFYDQGIHFSVLTLEHTGGTNQHDIEYARKWCKKNDVFQKVVRIDMQRFLKTSVFEYVDQGYISHYMFRYLQLRLLEIVESMGGFAVLGGGEQYYEVDPKKKELTANDVYLRFESDLTIPLEWIRRNGTAHEPYFLRSTPELCLSYLRIPLIEFVIDHPDILRHPASTYTLKRLVYQSVWPDSEARPKYHGFEKVAEDAMATKRVLMERYPEYSKQFRITVPELRRQLQSRNNVGYFPVARV